MEAHESVTGVLAAILCAQEGYFDLLVAGLTGAVISARVAARIGDPEATADALYGSEWNVHFFCRSAASRVYGHMFLAEIGYGWPRDMEVGVICQMVLGHFFTDDEAFGTSTYTGHAQYWSRRLSDALLESRDAFEIFTSLMDVGTVSVWGSMAAIRRMAQNAMMAQGDTYVRPPSIFYPISGAPLGITSYRVQRARLLRYPLTQLLRRASSPRYVSSTPRTSP